MRLYRYVVALLCAAALGSSPIPADAIDFETVPGAGIPFEGMSVSDQYAATEGVTFSLLAGGSPVIAEVGPPRTAFAGPPNQTGSDTVASGQGVGQFFLTDDGVVGLDSETLVVTYDPPAAEASGVILDMDGPERFTVEVRDSNGDVTEAIVIFAGDPLTGDGRATPWNVVRPEPDIATIAFIGERDDAFEFGLGFDNFNARSAPDTDGDGLFDNADNCVEAANADQRDTDADGFGNECDPDLTNDCLVNFGDLALLKGAFFPNFSEDADFNGDGFVNFGDLARMKELFFNSSTPGPGPSGVPNACDDD